MRTKHPQSQRPAITIAPTMPARHPQCYKYDTHLHLQQSKPWQTAVFIRIAAASKKSRKRFHCFFSMEAVGMCHVSQVPKELAFVSRKMGAMEKNKNQTIYSFTLKYLEVKKFIQTFSKNFKKSCLSFNFPLCNIWKNHLFILRIALSLFLCQAALMCITLFRTLPTAATRWLASRLTKVWVLAFFFGLMRFDDRWKNFIL